MLSSSHKPSPSGGSGAFRVGHLVPRLLLLCPDAGVREEFEEAMQKNHPEVVIRSLDSYPKEDELDFVIRHFAPTFIALSFEQPHVAARLAGFALRTTGGAPMIGLGPTCTIDLLHTAMRAGMREFFSLPIDRAQLGRAMAAVQSLMREHPPDISYSRNVFGFWSPKPGSGATTLALHAANELARQTGMRTLLLDLDRRASLTRFLLKQQQGFGIIDALPYQQEIDETIWGRMVSKTGRIDCVSLGVRPAASPMGAKELLPFLRYAHSHYDLVCVDLPSGFDAELAPLLEECTGIFVTAALELGPLYVANQALAFLKSLGMEGQSRVVLTRFRDGALADCAKAALPAGAFATVPNCYAELQKAAERGTLLDGRTKYGKSIHALVGKTLGTKPAVEKRESTLSLLTRWFRRENEQPCLEAPRRPAVGLLAAGSPDLDGLDLGGCAVTRNGSAPNLQY